MRNPDGSRRHTGPRLVEPRPAPSCAVHGTHIKPCQRCADIAAGVKAERERVVALVEGLRLRFPSIDGKRALAVVIAKIKHIPQESGSAGERGDHVPAQPGEKEGG